MFTSMFPKQRSVPSPQRRLALALAFISCLAAAHQVSAEPLVIDIDVDPKYADTMPVFEVTILDDVGPAHLSAFVEECQLRAELQHDSDWYLAAVSHDDLLTCRSRDLTRVEEMDLETSTQRLAIRGLHTDRESGQEVLAVFVPTVGTEQRLRFLDSGQSWSEWTPDPILRRVPVPASGAEGLTEFEVQMRSVGSSERVAMSGYIKIKKLNSGD